jgi:hypothetical protein
MIFYLLVLFIYFSNGKEVAIEFSSVEKFEEFMKSCEQHCLSHLGQVVENIHRFTYDESTGKKRDIQFDDVLVSLDSSGLSFLQFTVLASSTHS